MKGKYKQNEKKTRYFIVILGGVILLLMLLFLSFCNHPSADDYNYSVDARQYGFFGAQYHWYIQWSGRYFSILLTSLSPLVFGSFYGYKLMSFVIIIFSFASFYFVINTLFNKSGLLEKFYLVSLIFFSFILLMPSLTEAFYWWAGAYSYQIGNILTLLLFTLIIVYKAQPSKKLFSLSVIVIIALAGSNETSMFITVLTLFLITILKSIRDKKIDFFFLVIFSITIVCSLVVYYSPGNALRASSNINNHQLLFSLRSSVAEAIDVIGNWWWIGVFIIFTTYNIVADRIKNYEENRFSGIYLNPFLVLALIFVIISAGFFTCYWSLGLYPPLRAINTIYFYFIIGSIYAGICLAVKIKRSGIKIPDMSVLQMLIPLLLMVYIYKYPNNVSTAFSDIKDGVACRYDKELNERYHNLNTSDCNICPVNKLKNIPTSLYFKDISEETDQSMLRSYAAFFNKDSIFVEIK